MTHPGVPPGAHAPTPPPVPPRDSTRTIAIVALCVAGGAMLLQLATFVLPFFLFAGFGLLSSGFEEGGWEDPAFPGDGWMAQSYGSAFGGQVTPSADGSVAGAALTTAVLDLMWANGPDQAVGDDLECDDVAKVASDVSVLCHSQDPTSYAVVVFEDASGAFAVHFLATED